MQHTQVFINSNLDKYTGGWLKGSKSGYGVQVMCDVWREMCDVWCVMYDMWCRPKKAIFSSMKVHFSFLNYNTNITQPDTTTTNVQVCGKEAYIQVAERWRTFAKARFVDKRMCDVWCVMCDVWRVMCDLWCVMCDLWCVMCDVWRVIYDVWWSSPFLFAFRKASPRAVGYVDRCCNHINTSWCIKRSLTIHIFIRHKVFFINNHPQCHVNAVHITHRAAAWFCWKKLAGW